MSLEIKEYNYNLPPNLIANKPSFPRDCCRLMCLDRHTQEIHHRHFYELLDQLSPNDVLVLNQSQVFPARIFGQKTTGGQVEILLCQQISKNSWLSISRSGLKQGTVVNFSKELTAQVLKRDSESGEIIIEFNQSGSDFFNTLNEIGFTPIPPYIKPADPELKLRQKYQTVYAKDIGSAAAPTAGLHFTKSLLKKIVKKGIQVEYLTLHVGLGTFQPLRPNNLESKKLHLENFEIATDVAFRLNQAKKNGKRIIAVGTTTVRALESSVETIRGQVSLIPGPQSTEIFIYPPYKFKFTDALITNFHLPESSLLMLVSAFISAPNSPHVFNKYQNSLIGQAYQEAIEQNYRFFSFGDAMVIT